MEVMDPLYGPVELDEVALAIIDTPEFQRLRRIRQLSMANLVYQGAVHTRFEHAVGVYHVARSALQMLEARGDLDGIDRDDILLIAYSALCHDLGHYPAAHSAEAVGYPGVCHEAAGARYFLGGEVGAILRGTGIDRVGERMAELVQGRSLHPLAGLVSGDCDPDKLDYLRRDGYHCGVAQGFDQKRLRAGLRLLVNPETGQGEIGIDASVLLPFEQMLYTKNMMYRNVYFHPVVVSATVMLRSLIISALEAGLVGLEELQDWTDEEALMALRLRVGRGNGLGEVGKYVASLVDRLHTRRLYAVAASLPAADSPVVPHGTLVAVEREIAAILGVEPGSVLMDVPHKPTMLSSNILVGMPDGEVRDAGTLGPEHGFAMNGMREVLEDAAGHVRLFTSGGGHLAPERFREVLEEAVARVCNAEAVSGR